MEGDDDDCVALEDPNKRHLVDEVSIKVSLCVYVYIVCHCYPCVVLLYVPYPFVWCMLFCMLSIPCVIITIDVCHSATTIPSVIGIIS